MVAAENRKPTWHAHIPKDLRGNLAWRLLVSRRMAMDKDFAAVIKQACREDILFWINGFVWTYDPRRKPFRKIPMITYGYQDHAILKIVDAIEDGHDLLIEKSRDMGASWVCLMVFQWFWMYRDLVSFLLVSRVEAYVDEPRNPKSLFWKIDFCLKNLPPSLRPPVRTGIDRTFLHLVNPENGSVIDGESTTGDVARGDRRTAMLLDEFAAVDRGHEVASSTRDASNCRIFNSTHKGTATAYYDLSREEELQKVRMHWSQHPLKSRGAYTKRLGVYVPIDLEYWATREDVFNAQAEKYDKRILSRGVSLEDGKIRSPWYARECMRAAHAVEISQELDIDCMGSDHQFFPALMIEDYIKQYCIRPFHTGELEFDEETLEPIRWREDSNGKIRLWMELDGNGNPVGSRFALGCDIAVGTGSSNSVATAISLLSNEKVLEFASPFIRPEAFARYCVALAKWLSEAQMIWEQNGPGRPFGDAVIESEYRNIYMRVNDERLSKIASKVPGWVPTKDSKLALLTAYRFALDRQTFVNRNEQALRECLEYVFLQDGTVEHSKTRKSLDPTGARKNHGDRVMADALAWKLASYRGARKKRGDEPREIVEGSFAWRRKWHEEQEELAEVI